MIRAFCRRPAAIGLILAVAVVILIGWADTWEGLRREAGEIRTVRADFIQKKHLPILAEPLVSEGSFAYSAPDALRWAYRTPVDSVLLMDDGDVTRYTRTDEGLIREAGGGLSAMDAVVGEITAWLDGRFVDNPAFEAELAPGRRIILTPVDPAFGAFIQRIVLHLSDRPGLLKSVVIVEGPEAYTEILFKDAAINVEIDPSVFRSPS